MINLISLTKIILIFSLVYFLIVTGLIYLLPNIGVDGLSDTRIAFLLGTVFEFILLYLFTSGWRKVWSWFPILNEWLFPDLNGEWDAKIIWNWDDKTGTKNGIVYIKQSFIKISVDLSTDESESTTLLVKPFKDPESDQPSFYYMYRSESKSLNHQEKTDHKGAAIIKRDIKNNNILSGNYFTDRKTFGRYTFTKK